MTELAKLSPELEGNISNLEKMVFVVQDSESREGVVAAARKAKSIKAMILEFFKESREFADKAHKAICANQGIFTKRCDIVERRGKEAITKWDDEQEAIREKERARLQAVEDALARKEQERLIKQAEKIKTPERSEALMEEAASIVAPVIQVAEKEKVKGESTSKTWKYRVTNIDEVPKEWWILNDKGLAAFAKSTKGTKDVKGIEFYPVSSLAITI